MSVKAVAWVLDDLQGLKPGPSLVMLALADFADERNSCFPGQERIAARARCSRRSVIAYLKELQELGLVSVERRAYSHGASGVRRSSNRYILHVGKTYGLEDAKSAPSSKSAGHDESAKSALSSLECANAPLSKVQPVALKEPPVIEPPVPSPQPPKGLGEDPGAATPLGGAPDGAPGEESGDLDLDYVLEGLTPAQRGALLEALGANEISKPASDSLQQDQLVSLAREVLPAAMQAMGPASLAQVGEMISQRLEAGWTRGQLTAVLQGRELPTHVRSMVALVKARLRDDTPVESAPPAGMSMEPTTDSFASPWTHTLPDGRVITRRDLDGGAIFLDFSKARSQGLWRGDDRWEFAVVHGLEKYLMN